MSQQFYDLVQQEVWATIRALNDAWTMGNPDDLQHYFHADMVAITPTDRLRREGAAACIAGWKDFANAAKIHAWQEREPLIRVFGEAAVVSYYYDISFEMGGRVIALSGRDMFFLIREQGRWWVVADQFSSTPA